MLHTIAKFLLRIVYKKEGVTEIQNIRKILQAHGLGNNHATREKAATAILEHITKK